MRCLTNFVRVLGICLLCLGTVAFFGCSDSGNSSAGITPPDSTGNTGNTGQDDCNDGCISVFPMPTYPTAQDRSIAAVQPHYGKGFATLAPFAINAQTGRQVIAGGKDPSITAWLGCNGADNLDDVELTSGLVDGKDGCVIGRVPLSTCSDYSSIRTLLPVIFPVGDNCLALSRDTFIGTGVKNSSMSSFSTIISKLKVAFTVINDLGEPKWTLPSCIEMRCNMCNGKSYLAGSQLILKWDPSRNSLAPHGRAYVVANVKFYNNKTLVFSARKPVPVIDNQAIYTSQAKVLYNRIEAEFDLTNNY